MAYFVLVLKFISNAISTALAGGAKRDVELEPTRDGRRVRKKLIDSPRSRGPYYCQAARAGEKGSSTARFSFYRRMHSPSRLPPLCLTTNGKVSSTIPPFAFSHDRA